ncbi:MAG: maleylpyruvate isomerase N-terminal domain-containing protein [Stackebrandtia sp.]
MELRRAEILTLIEAATERLLDTVADLTGERLREDSLLPGWSRGHVLTHVARQADAMRNLLAWARTGIPTPAYASREARDADIEAGAGRDATALIADLRESAAAFAEAVAVMPDDAWDVEVEIWGNRIPVTQVLARRIAELELHHVDLGLDYRPADWSAEFDTMDLPVPLDELRDERRSW